ncbi:MAG TPA: hypothetical protein VFE62_13575 [Gemmataceae bacterium]|nr:hypothetical protein [Gemmataceae bacterium]
MSDSNPKPQCQGRAIRSRQDFDHEPGSDELACFVDPSVGLAAWLRVAESKREVRVEPGTIHLWFVTLCLIPVLAVTVWYWYGALSRGLDHPLQWMGLIITCLALPGIFLIVGVLNRQFTAMGTFCVVNLVDAKLDLPRLGLTVGRPEIRSFVEFHGWCGGMEKVQARELSVIVCNEAGMFSRHQVVIGQGWPVSRLGKRLAEFYDVPLTIVTLSF